jgi:hypothetical protein
MAKRYCGDRYVIGLDSRSSMGSLMSQLRKVAQATVLADKAAGVEVSQRRVKRTPKAFRKAMDGLGKV